MNAWIHLPVVTALGWAVVHFVWEGAVLALLASGVLAVTRSSRVRYAAACIAMLAMIVAFAVTAAVAIPDPQPGARADQAVRTTVDLNGLRGGGNLVLGFLERLEREVPWIVPYWIAGAFLIGAWRVTGWMAAERIRRNGVCTAPSAWQERLRELGRRIGVSRAVRLLESSLTGAPVVIGFLRPAILMPAGLLAGLPADQVEAILLHELAHVRRLDYVVNLMQSFVESVLFYHPAVWWVSRVMRSERENCCDDVVVAVEGNPRGYAEALVKLEERRSAGQEPALAATGGQLMNRIRRLLNQPEEPRAAAGLVVSVVVLAGIFCLFAAAQQPPRDTRNLPPSYQRWLNEEVVYIIEPQERAVFLALTTDEERDHFITQFWDRRGKAFKQEHYRRIAYANERFHSAKAQGWKTDRGRIYIIYGPPDEIESHPNDGREVWRYRHIPGIADDVFMEFVDPNHTGDYRMTEDPSVKRDAKK